MMRITAKVVSVPHQRCWKGLICPAGEGWKRRGPRVVAPAGQTSSLVISVCSVSPHRSQHGAASTGRLGERKVGKRRGGETIPLTVTS